MLYSVLFLEHSSVINISDHLQRQTATHTRMVTGKRR